MTTPHPQVNLPPGIERRRNPRLLILLLVLFCGLFIAGYVERLAELDSIRDEVEKMRAQIAVSQQRNANLREDLERAQDPYYLALMARDEIGLVQDGDLPVVVYEGIPEPTPAPAVERVERATVADAPWQQWLELIFPFAGNR